MNSTNIYRYLCLENVRYHVSRQTACLVSGYVRASFLSRHSYDFVEQSSSIKSRLAAASATKSDTLSSAYLCRRLFARRDNILLFTITSSTNVILFIRRLRRFLEFENKRILIFFNITEIAGYK